MQKVEEVVAGAIGRRVRALREAKGWSRRRLAHAVDVTENTIYRIEKGRVVPSLETLQRIARAFGIASPMAFYPPVTESDERIVAGIVRVA